MVRTELSAFAPRDQSGRLEVERDSWAMNMLAVGSTQDKLIHRGRNIPGTNYCTATISEGSGA